METFTFDATPTEAQLRAVVGRAARTAKVILYGCGAVLVIYGLGLFIADELPRSFALGFMGVGVLMMLLLPSYKIRRILRATSAKLGRPTSYRIDAAGIFTGNDLTNGTVSWALIRAIEELPQVGVVLARVGKAMFIPIPVDGLAPQARAALLAFMRAHAGAPDIPPPPTPGAVAPGVPPHPTAITGE